MFGLSFHCLAIEMVQTVSIHYCCFTADLSKTPFNRFSKQYSKDYKAKEVSEGEESKDFWNVLGGKAQFHSLSGGVY